MLNLTHKPKISTDNNNNKMKKWYKITKTLSNKSNAHKISILIFKDKIQIREIIEKVKCICNKGKMSTLMIIM